MTMIAEQTKMPRKIKSWQELNETDRKFKEIFGVGFKRFLDMDMLKAGCGVMLNIVQFDNYLKNEYREYKEGMSMSEFVSLKFGKDANELLEELI